MLCMYLQERVFLGETKLEHDPIEQDVGILISHYLSWNHHIDVISSVAYPSVGITLSVNHIYTFVSFRFLLSTTCYNAVKSLILRKKGKRNSVGK